MSDSALDESHYIPVLKCVNKVIWNSECSSKKFFEPIVPLIDPFYWKKPGSVLQESLLAASE
jgi:hypothetical protein